MKPFSFTLWLSLIWLHAMQAQLTPFPLEVSSAPKELIFKSNKLEGYPILLHADSNYLWYGQDKVGNFARTYKEFSKIDLRNGEEQYRVEVDDSKFKGKKLYFEDQHFYNGEVHLLYRSKKSKEDSVYLVDVKIDQNGQIAEPKVLLASWVGDDKSDDNIEMFWNENRSQLTVVAMRNEPASGKTRFIRRVFDKDLEKSRTHSFVTDFPFGSVYVLEKADIQDDTYLFLLMLSENRAQTAIMKIDHQHVEMYDAAVKHRYAKSFTLHKLNDQLLLSYLSFEDEERNEMDGYHSFVIDTAQNTQKLLTNISFGEHLKESNEDLYEFIREESSYATEKYSIKSILQHPQGGYVLSLHQNYAYIDDYSTYPTYYSSDFLILYIDASGSLQWQKAFPLDVGYLPSEHINNFMSFDQAGNFVLLTPNSSKNIENWKEGKFKYNPRGDVGVSVIQISVAGETSYELMWQKEDEMFVPSLGNMYQLEGSHEFYSFMQVPKRKSKLVKLSLPNWNTSAATATYSLHKYGRQR